MNEWAFPVSWLLPRECCITDPRQVRNSQILSSQYNNLLPRTFYFGFCTTGTGRRITKAFLCVSLRQPCQLWLDWQGQKAPAPSTFGHHTKKEGPKTGHGALQYSQVEAEAFSKYIRNTCHFHTTFVQCHRKSGVSQLAKELSWTVLERKDFLLAGCSPEQ